VLLGSSRLFVWLLAAVLGSVLYRLIIAVVLRLGFEPTDLKLFTAVIVTIALISPSLKGYFGKMISRKDVKTIGEIINYMKRKRRGVKRGESS
jgi:ABC-type uncharacterized transport system permease subunit